MATSISIDRLTKSFGAGGSRSVVVDGISVDVRPGELFFLLGPSGCGKTTLLRMIAGFLEPTSGRVLFDGRDVTRVPANRRNCGMVFQSYALWPHMTVEANVAFGLDVRHIRAPERARRVADALESVRMSEFARRRPNELSGGQQQRVALARALVIRPDVLLLDEPLSNLDARLRTELRAEIRRICKEFPAPGGGAPGITTIYVTHDQKEALSMSDRIAIVDRGRLVQLGPPDALYRTPATRFVAEFLGETNLVRGTLVERRGGSATIETPLGRLVSGDGPGAGAGVGTGSASPVLCSIRPEALRIVSDGAPVGSANTFSGRIIETTYLGDSCQQVVECSGLKLKLARLHPGYGGAVVGERVALAVDPRDIVLLADDS